MQAITTKYHGPTDRRGSRITATAAGGKRATVPYRHDLSGADVHFEAVKALCKRLDWTGDFTVGGLKDGYVFVFCDGGQYQVRA